MLPPLLPLQVQFHGPEPVTADAVPAEHKLVVGAVAVGVPFAEPQAPLIGGGVTITTLAEHDAVVPPLLPTQLHVHDDPVSDTVVAVPALHRFVVGSLVVGTPLAEPHCPFTLCMKCRASAGV
jgi:hypothetical protein